MKLDKKIMKLLIEEHEARPSTSDKREWDLVSKPLEKYGQDCIVIGINKLKSKCWIDQELNYTKGLIYYPTEKGIDAMDAHWNIDRRLVILGIVVALLTIFKDEIIERIP